MSTIYLSSNSPRRAELLTQIGVDFSIISAPIDEIKDPSESPTQYVTRLAIEKAKAGYLVSKKNKPVLGSDTIVVLGSHILEKPKDFNHFLSMMNLLSGKTHQVFTAIAMVYRNKIVHKLVKTEVTFCELTAKDTITLWNSHEPIDKAGGYGIQGIAGKFITNISGSYSCVVGLPLYETEQLINEFIGDTYDIS